MAEKLRLGLSVATLIHSSHASQAGFRNWFVGWERVRGVAALGEANVISYRLRFAGTSLQLLIYR